MSFIHQVLGQYWGYAQFRPLQEDIIRSVMSGKDTLALLPTGGGKSLCYQVPALAQPGLCLVVSPLIALMKDQEDELKKKGIRAVALLGGMKRSEIELALGNCMHGDFKFLFVSPERLGSASFREALLKMPLNLIAVDEAHCISQWGYDFRPPYLQIAEIRDNFPQVPVLALTASATPEVREDICEKLRFKDRQVFAKSFARGNLSYLVRYSENKIPHLLKVLKSVPGTSIVYVRNRRRTQEIARELQLQGISADYYHAGLDQQTRAERQNSWMQNHTRVIVSTNAFGMGINKPDVRSVIHLDLPDDLESYYQEAGRGGRDEKPSYAVVLYDQSDLAALEQRKSDGFPPREDIRKVYNTLCNYLQVPIDAGYQVRYDFELTEFCRHYQLQPLAVMAALRILEIAGYVSIQDAFFIPARMRFLVKGMDLYTFQVQYPKMDALIKIILRSYTGLFDDYVRFSESELAKRAEISVEMLQKLLQQLHGYTVIEYLPAMEKPGIILTHERVRENELLIAKAHLEDRQQRFVQRADAFRRFIESTHDCRSILLLSYFGEKQLVRCGTCDICRERNKVPLNDRELEALAENIRLQLEHGPQSAAALKTQFTSISDEAFRTALEWLLDREDIGNDIAGCFFLKR